MATSTNTYAITLAFLYNLAKFVRWPTEAFASHSTELEICMFGTSALAPHLNTLTGKRAIGRVLSVRFPKELKDLSQCHVLLVAVTENENMEQVLATVSGRPVLTISDLDHFVQQGGMIGITQGERSIELTINMAACARQKIKISSQLLSLARIIKK